jgi:hypothetical protein
MRMRQRKLEVPEQFARTTVRGSFEALLLAGYIQLESGETEFAVIRAWVSPYGRRWERVGSDEIRLAVDKEDAVVIYRLEPKTKTAYIESSEPLTQKVSPRKPARRVEVYRGLRCRVEEVSEREAEGLIRKSREWRVLDTKAENWPMRSELRLLRDEQLSAIMLWDTLDIKFQPFPRQLFMVPPDYKIVR